MKPLSRGTGLRRHTVGVDSARRAVPGALVFALLTVVASLNGGYFPSTWGWVALGLLLVAATALLALETIVLGRLDRILLLSLGAFLLWTALSMLWSESLPRTVLELQRDLVYLAAVAAFLLFLRRSVLVSLLGGILLSTVAVSAYALGTRLLPDWFGPGPGPADAARLTGPLGYWNALGLFAVVGVLLALGFAASGRPRLIRCGAAASLLVLVPTLYFTFGRAAWVALAVGMGAAVAVDRRRMHMALMALALVPGPAVGVWLASRADALGDAAAAPDAAHERYRLAVALLVLAVASAFAPLLVERVESRIRLPRGSRRAFSGLVVALLALVVALVVRTGGPGVLLGDAYDAFRAPMPVQSGGLERRLVSFSGTGRSDYWQIAWSDYKSHPWLGSGAGTYELSWDRERPNAFGARDAHSLYLEALAELGPVGLALLLAALGTPLLALARGRHDSLTAAAAGAYVAFVFHAAADWDWEMPAVTLAGLLCGVAVLVNSRHGEERLLASRERAVALVAAVALGAFAFVSAVGNGAVSSSTDALAHRKYAQAESHARRATKWAPWSSEAWRLLGEAQLARGNVAAARASFQAAIRRDPHDWLPWSDLLSVTRGAERLHALTQVSRLNPRSLVLETAP